MRNPLGYKVLRTYQQGEEIYELVKSFTAENLHRIADPRLIGHMNDSARSVPRNIAEGSPKSEMDFYKFPIDSTIKDRVDQITIFTSNNEEEDGKKGMEMFRAALGGDVISLKNHGHYILDEMGTDEFSELIEEVIK